MYRSDVLEAWDRGYEAGVADGRRRRAVTDVKKRREMMTTRLPAGHTATIIDWAEARRVRGMTGR